MDQESIDVIGQITADTDVVAKLADGATVPLGTGGFSTFRLWELTDAVPRSGSIGDV